jgi:hypothetical protein
VLAGLGLFSELLGLFQLGNVLKLDVFGLLIA